MTEHSRPSIQSRPVPLVCVTSRERWLSSRPRLAVEMISWPLRENTLSEMLRGQTQKSPSFSKCWVNSVSQCVPFTLTFLSLPTTQSLANSYSSFTAQLQGQPLCANFQVTFPSPIPWTPLSYIPSRSGSCLKQSTPLPIDVYPAPNLGSEIESDR